MRGGGGRERERVRKMYRDRGQNCRGFFLLLHGKKHPCMLDGREGALCSMPQRTPLIPSPSILSPSLCISPLVLRTGWLGGKTVREGQLLPGKVEEAEAAVVGPRAEEKFPPPPRLPNCTADRPRRRPPPLLSSVGRRWGKVEQRRAEERVEEGGRFLPPPPACQPASISPFFPSPSTIKRSGQSVLLLLFLLLWGVGSLGPRKEEEAGAEEGGREVVE